jgi:hypothetical protein
MMFQIKIIDFNEILCYVQILFRRAVYKRSIEFDLKFIKLEVCLIDSNTN